MHIGSDANTHTSCGWSWPLLRQSSIARLAMLAAAVGMVALSGCGPQAPAVAPEAVPFIVRGDRIVIPAGSPLRSQIAIATVGSTSIAQDVVAPAIVEADPARQYRILSPLAGRIARLGARLGDRVHAGQALALLTSPDLSSALADDARARAQLRLTGSARDRSVALKGIGGAADKDVEQARADYAAAQAEAARTGERLRQVGATAAVDGGGLALTAPSSGIVTDLAAAPGAFWTDPTAPLMTVTDIDTVWVTANVAESDLGAIREGQPVRIAFTAYPGEIIAGQVRSIAPLLDPDTRRAKVRIVVANPDGRFKPGMFATVSFASAMTAGLTVPTTALLLKDDATTVYVEVGPWTFERRTVDTGPEQRGRTAITLGLSSGQRVIAKGGVLLDD